MIYTFDTLQSVLGLILKKKRNKTSFFFFFWKLCKFFKVAQYSIELQSIQNIQDLTVIYVV